MKQNGIIIILLCLILIVVLVLISTINKQVFIDDCLLDIAEDICEDNNMVFPSLMNRHKFQCLSQEERDNHEEGIHTFYFTEDERGLCSAVNIRNAKRNASVR